MGKKKRIVRQFKKDLSKLKKNKESFTIDELVAFFTEISDGIEPSEEEQARFFSERANVLDHVIRNPGTFLDNMEKELGVNSYVLILHLNILLHFKLIKKKKISDLDMYYHSEVKSEDANKDFYLLKKEFYYNIENIIISRSGEITLIYKGKKEHHFGNC